MRKLAFLLFLLPVPFSTLAQNKKPPTTLRGVLLEQLRHHARPGRLVRPGQHRRRRPHRRSGQVDPRQRQPLRRPARLSPLVLEQPRTRHLQGREAARLRRQQQRNLRQLHRRAMGRPRQETQPGRSRLGEGRRNLRRPEARRKRLAHCPRRSAQRLPHRPDPLRAKTPRSLGPRQRERQVATPTRQPKTTRQTEGAGEGKGEFSRCDSGPLKSCQGPTRTRHPSSPEEPEAAGAFRPLKNWEIR